MEKRISITGIKLKSNGMKGMDVVYNQQHEKDGKVWNATDTSERKVPVGEELEKVIKAFRYYLMDIYGYNMDDVNVADCLVTAVDFDGGIMICGELKVMNGIKVVKLKTPSVSDDHEYEKMDELRKLVGQLKVEVEKYMEGKSVMSDSQLVMSFYKGKGKFDEVEFAGMSDEDKKAKATEILEKMGSIVIHNSEMDGSYVPEEVGEAVVLDTDVKPFVNDNAVSLVEQMMVHEDEHEKLMRKGVAELKKAKDVGVPAPNFEAQATELKLEEVLITEDEDGEEMFSIAPIKVA